MGHGQHGRFQIADHCIDDAIAWRTFAQLLRRFDYPAMDGRCREFGLLQGQSLDNLPERGRKPLPTLVMPDLAG
jgi:hypothetical protein